LANPSPSEGNREKEIPRGQNPSSADPDDQAKFLPYPLLVMREILLKDILLASGKTARKDRIEVEDETP
jgi:hypothetical protein